MIGTEHKINSSMMNKMTYFNNGELLVEYVNGTIYKYLGVSQDIFEDLLHANEDKDASFGKLFNTIIKKDKDITYKKLEVDKDKK